jgi:hypothetical protein
MEFKRSVKAYGKTKFEDVLQEELNSDYLTDLSNREPFLNAEFDTMEAVVNGVDDDDDDTFEVSMYVTYEDTAGGGKAKTEIVRTPKSCDITLTIDKVSGEVIEEDIGTPEVEIKEDK